MNLILALVSIIVITTIVFSVNKILKFKVCAICAGVSLTWIWFLGASFLGFETDTVLIALLMGGSVVGLSYAAAEHIKKISALAVKTLFIVLGTIVAFGLINFYWSLFVTSFILYLIIYGLLRENKKSEISSQKKQLMEKMENCCQ